jgi:hypothetical protein
VTHSLGRLVFNSPSLENITVDSSLTQLPVPPYPASSRAGGAPPRLCSLCAFSMPALCATVAQRPPLRWRSRARVRRSRRARAPRVPSGARVRVIPPRDSLGFSLHIVMQRCSHTRISLHLALAQRVRAARARESRNTSTIQAPSRPRCHQ